PWTEPGRARSQVMPSRPPGAFVVVRGPRTGGQRGSLVCQGRAVDHLGGRFRCPTLRRPARCADQGRPQSLLGACTEVRCRGLVLATMRPGGEFCEDRGVRPTVLIVDDHDGFRESARALLEAEGFAVVGDAADGATAVGAVARLRPDVV